jgi:hypothetical protein
MTSMDESKEAQRARAAKADLAEILERRPDLKGKSIEAVRRVLRREARLSLRPRRTSKTRKLNPAAPGRRRIGVNED